MDIVFAGFTLKARERLLVGKDGSVDLGARAVDVLRVLISRPNEVISKDSLLSQVWPGAIVEENALQAQISALRRALGADMIATLHGRGYKYAGPKPTEVASGQTAAPPREDRKPVVAVLPFANLSGDLSQQYFSDGITEDIIDRLSRFRMLDVIGWHSASALQGADRNFQEIRDRLHADYVVTGNIKRAAGRIRVAARLTDTARETVLWAEHYDRVLEDIFDIQDEVAEIIVSTLSRHVEADMALRPRPKSDLSSYELVLKGMMYLRKSLVTGADIAADCFRRALEINPDCAEAMRGLSVYHIERWTIECASEDLAAAMDYGKRGGELDPSNAPCLACLGWAQLMAHGVEAARPAMQRALEINPGDSYVLADMGLLATYDGRLADARKLLEAALRLNPIPPYWFAGYWGIIDFAEGRFAEAARLFGQAGVGKIWMTYVLASLGHIGDGQALAEPLAQVSSRGWDLMEVVDAVPYRDPAMRERLREGLQLALSF